MARPLTTFSFQRCGGLLLVLAGILTLLVTGCNSPQERYQVLSFFFDGVPNPDAPKFVHTVASADHEGPAVVQMMIVSRHKPYVENKCDFCHQSAAGTIMEFDEAYKGCVRCHSKVTTEHPRMHGPVARAACQWCHAPHESAQPYLLKDDPIKVCTQCHDQQLLGNTPIQHTDGHTACTSCHFGHGGDAQNFLKPEGHVDWPTTQPAALLATPPATQPAGPPATEPAAPRLELAP